MNITDCICKYENVTELELKAHIGSSTYQMYQKFVLHIFELRISSQNVLYMWISQGKEKSYFAKIA